MKVLVLGATGGAGRQILRALSARGDSVVAIVRPRPEAVDLGAVETIAGDARDAAVLDRALGGCDAVISALGAPVTFLGEVTVLSSATRELVGAMQRRGVRRLIAITGLGAGDSRGHGGWLYDRLILPLVLRKVYQDKDRQEAIIRASGLDWIIVRPVMLTNGAARGGVQAASDPSQPHGGRITRADVADFIVAQLDSDRWIGQTPLIWS